MERNTYGYVRVSTQVQNEARQLAAMREFGVEDENIIIEKQSGRDFKRPLYQQLVDGLRAGDVLVVKSIDRLGRNYTEILEQWAFITKKQDAAIVVLDMPLLDTRQGRDLTGTLISDIVLQLLSYVAQTERESIRQRQRSGASGLDVSGWNSRRIFFCLRSCGRRAAFRPGTLPGSWGFPIKPSCVGRRRFPPSDKAVTKSPAKVLSQ